MQKITNLFWSLARFLATGMIEFFSRRLSPVVPDVGDGGGGRGPEQSVHGHIVIVCDLVIDGYHISLLLRIQVLMNSR